MLNLIAASYYNIGPFKDKHISIFWNKGKYLIKAPIGSGKSFLFFDAPMFGLYKTSNRNVLNVNAKEGYIKILFEVSNEYYLIIRALKKGKIKDSCTSTLYSITNGDTCRELEQKYAGIQIDTDIQDIVQEKKILWEEISFKNENDFQQNLNDLLPPKEVLVTTTFLLQDAPNIFELMPAERISILKNIFWLLGIDEAKEKISDKKKEIQTQIKIYGETESYNNKLTKNIKNYIKIYDSMEVYTVLQDILKKYHDQIQEIKDIEEKITIHDFDEENLPSELSKEIRKSLEEEKKQHQEREQELKNIKKNKEEKEKEVNNYRHEIQVINRGKNQVDTIIKGIDKKKLQSTKEKKQSLYQEKESWEERIPKKEIQDFLQEKKEITIDTVGTILSDIINKGKIVNEEKKLLESQKETIVMQEKYEIQQREQIKKLYEQAKKKRQENEKTIEQQESFSCEKIQANCPFIKVINKKTFNQLSAQQNVYIQEEKELQQQVIKKEWEIKKIQEEHNIKKNEEEIQKKEKEIHAIKTFLQDIDYKTLESLSEKAKTIQTEIRTLDQEINKQEAELEKLQTYEKEYQKYIIQEQEITKQIQEKELQYAQYKKEEELQNNKTFNLSHEDINNIEQDCKSRETGIHDIQLLTKEYKTNQLKTKQLQEDEKILSNLYQIFTKELLLLVLEDNLPLLTDIINAYLSQVVEYQLQLQLIKTSTEKLELEASISDEKGIREVKSLSWGQKIILKLVWMLSISSFMQTKILFLDETINNLDADTVGKVSEMLGNVVKQRDIKFYTITHNQQIQDMKIWDNIFEVDQFL